MIFNDDLTADVTCLMLMGGRTLTVGQHLTNLRAPVWLTEASATVFLPFSCTSLKILDGRTVKPAIHSPHWRLTLRNVNVGSCFVSFGKSRLKWKGKEEYLYSAIYTIRIVSRRSDVDHTCSFTCKYTCLPSFVSDHQMAPPLIEVAEIQLQLSTDLSTPRDERLSWPSWLTYSGQFTHITRQLQVERRTGKVYRPKLDVLPVWHAIEQEQVSNVFHTHFMYILLGDRRSHLYWSD